MVQLGSYAQHQSWISQDGAAAKFVMTIPFSQRHLPCLGHIFKGGWWPKHLRESATRDYPEGRFEVISRPLHKGMCPWGAASANAKARFSRSAIKYPAYCFEDSNLLWKGDVSRLPSVEEKELLFGLPANFTRVSTHQHKRLDDETRLRLLGNAWRVRCSLSAWPWSAGGSQLRGHSLRALLQNCPFHAQCRSQLCTCGAFQAWLSRRMWSASHLL